MTRRPIDAHVSPARTANDHLDDALRGAFAAWASGVSVVSARDDDGRVYGMTIAALTPGSIDPPLVLVCIHNDAPLASVLDGGVRCALSILNEGQKRAATSFADRFSVGADLLTGDDVPAVRDAAATLRCTTRDIHDGGDHRIVVLSVDDVRVAGDEPRPLVYWQRAYRRLTADD
ncbi:MAG TPA: flavin reductase family protein [Longimicrobiales bacterium]